MNPVINKFLVAAVTCLGAVGVLASDGFTTEEWITVAILFANALGVYAIPNSVSSKSNIITRP